MKSRTKIIILVILLVLLVPGLIAVVAIVWLGRDLNAIDELTSNSDGEWLS